MSFSISGLTRTQAKLRGYVTTKRQQGSNPPTITSTRKCLFDPTPAMDTSITPSLESIDVPKDDDFSKTSNLPFDQFVTNVENSV